MHVVSVNVGLPHNVRWRGREAGDRVEALARHPARISVAEITRVHASDRDDPATIERLVALDALPEDWRRHFAKSLAALSTTTAN